MLEFICFWTMKILKLKNFSFAALFIVYLCKRPQRFIADDITIHPTVNK